MTAGVYVGVDSGGTRTNVGVRWVTEDNEVRSRSYEVGESFSGALSRELIPNTLRRILAPLERQVHESAKSPIYVWIGAAGFTPWTRDDFVVAVHDVLPAIANGAVRAVGIANDAVSLLLGSRADAVVIAGTGSNVVVKAPDGCLYQAGGHEWVACDYGSGFWIGLRSIRQAYRDYEAGIDSVLLQRLCEVYGVPPDNDDRLIAKLRELAISDHRTKRKIAHFTAAVCAAAERGDEGAQNVVKAEAEDLADVMSSCLRRRVGLEELSRGCRIVQCGSLLANDFYRTHFEAQLQMRLLSDTTRGGSISWHRTITGGDAAMQLAQNLQAAAPDLLRLNDSFRPAIVTA